MTSMLFNVGGPGLHLVRLASDSDSTYRRRKQAYEAVYHFSASPAGNSIVGFSATRTTETSPVPSADERFRAAVRREMAKAGLPDSSFPATSQLQLITGDNPMQKTLLIGYLGKDPEVKYTPGGTAIATFTIASTERWKSSAGEPQEHTEWFNIKAFGKRAEVVAEHLHKGSRIFLEGRQRTESWDDKQSGTKKYMTYVYADKVEFLGESQRDGQKAELTLDQSYSQEDPTMIADSDVPF